MAMESVACTTINNKHTFLTRLKWDENALTVNIFDFEDVKTWSGNISDGEIMETASALQINLTEYKAEITLAFKTMFNAEVNYQCTLQDNILAIKKIVSSSKIGFKIAKVVLTEVKLETVIPHLMATVAANLNQMASDVVIKDRQIETLSKERAELMDKSEKFTSTIEDYRTELFSNFAAAFNSLKDKVASSTVDADHSSSPSTSSQPFTRKKPVRKLSESDDDSYQKNTDVDTDEESPAFFGNKD